MELPAVGNSPNKNEVNSLNQVILSGNESKDTALNSSCVSFLGCAGHNVNIVKGVRNAEVCKEQMKSVDSKLATILREQIQYDYPRQNNVQHEMNDSGQSDNDRYFKKGSYTNSNMSNKSGAEFDNKIAEVSDDMEQATVASEYLSADNDVQGKCNSDGSKSKNRRTKTTPQRTTKGKSPDSNVSETVGCLPGHHLAANLEFNVCENLIPSIVNFSSVHSANVEKPFVCSLCGRAFLKKANLNTHFRIHFPKKVICTVCGQTFESKIMLRNHMLVHGNEACFMCVACNSVFRRLQDLNRHKIVHEKQYICDDCGKVYSRFVHFQKHKTSHHGDNKRKTLQNAERSSEVENASISNHLKELPGSLKEKTGKSKERNAKVNAKMRRNLVIEKLSRKYECFDCGKTFKTSFYLKTHLRTHTGEKPFMCKECGKSFTQLSSLQTHMRKHTGVKPYSCTHCGRAFSVRLYLQAHLRTHTGEKPFTCDICGRKFSQPSSLASHEKLHDRNEKLVVKFT